MGGNLYIVYSYFPVLFIINMVLTFCCFGFLFWRFVLFSRFVMFFFLEFCFCVLFLFFVLAFCFDVLFWRLIDWLGDWLVG